MAQPNDRPPWDQLRDYPAEQHFTGCWWTEAGQRQWFEERGTGPIPECACDEIAADLEADYQYDSWREVENEG